MVSLLIKGLFTSKFLQKIYPPSLYSSPKTSFRSSSVLYSNHLPFTAHPPSKLFKTNYNPWRKSMGVSVRHAFVPLNRSIDENTLGNTQHTLSINSSLQDTNNGVTHHKKEEITIYIKGFLSKGETPEEFEHWFRCHNLLTASHGWGSMAHGYYWKAGHSSWDKFLPYGTLAYSAFNLVTKRRIPLTPVGLAVAVVGEAALVGGRLWYEFSKAYFTAREYAPTLTQNLLSLSSQYSKIRCVAHSLGCVLLLESIKGLPEHSRPHEVHLLAPALIEDQLFDNIAKEHAYLYHCDRDLILNAASSLKFVAGEAVGLTGPKRQYQGLTPFDVSAKLGFFVHKEYRDVLHDIAADHKLFVRERDVDLGDNNFNGNIGSVDLNEGGGGSDIRDNYIVEKMSKYYW